jgi:hypothetical protein
MDKRKLKKILSGMEGAFNELEGKLFAELAQERRVKEEIRRRGGTIRRCLFRVVQADIPEDFQQELQKHPRDGWTVHEGFLTVRL